MAGMNPRLTKLLELTAAAAGGGEARDTNADVEVDLEPQGNSEPSQHVPSRDFAAMSSEEKSKLIDHIMGKEQSDAEVMKKSCDAFLDPASSLDDREEALDKMLFLADSIDNSMDIGKTGVMTKLMQGLSNGKVDVRTGSAWVLGVCLKDNPSLCAEWLHAGGPAGVVMALRDEDQANDEARSKYVTVLSATLETSASMQKFFSESGAYPLLTQPLVDGCEARSTAKCMFVLGKFVTAGAVGALEALSRKEVTRGLCGIVANKPAEKVPNGPQRVEMALSLISTCRSVGTRGGAYDKDNASTGIQQAVVACAKWAEAGGEDWCEAHCLAKHLL